MLVPHSRIYSGLFLFLVAGSTTLLAWPWAPLFQTDPGLRSTEPSLHCRVWFQTLQRPAWRRARPDGRAIFRRRVSRGLQKHGSRRPKSTNYTGDKVPKTQNSMAMRDYEQTHTLPACAGVQSKGGKGAAAASLS